ncbi:Chromate transporter [Desulfofarcimen acetoxidans DSM 771]|uniref:Chromate transporter n=1 Tax=Desulfofarcimen acetoxidans (strain ATCC 49208 / DSM 771 / KCTC 5769 / VKM B-1644 / 5575) TaxID=485916 RepID=C8W1P3_DESAS|nr:chromate transporter [Desulfofarcimen acetoxidans]ACV63514.1 Chromate transporter [Desulfofarcimen acetoxidans DSM 771]
MTHRETVVADKLDDKKKGIRGLIITTLATLPLCVLFWQLFLAFGRANFFGFGGGPAVIPLIQREVVNNYKWLSTEEFTDVLAMGNALPGPIATKMAAYVGYKISGLWGAAAALAGTVIPTAVAMLGLAGIYLKYKDTPQITGMLKGVRPVVVVLLLQTAWDMGLKSFPLPVTWIIALIALVLIFQFKMHPIILIIASMFFGYIFLSK